MFKKIDNEKLIITQANALALSAQKMTLQEKRLLLLLISYVRATDDNFKVYHLPVSDIKDYLELSGGSIYSKLHSVCRKLMGQVLFVEDGDGGWEMNQLVSKSKYVTGRKSENGVAHLQMRLHEDLRPLLLNLKERFGSIPLRQIVSMKSKYSIRLLEILYFSSHGLKKNTLHFSMDELKKRLGLKQTNETIDPFQEKYVNFKDFNREILERAKRECIERSPITFTYDLEKKGRKVIGLHFLLKRNPNNNIIDLPKNTNDRFDRIEEQVNKLEVSDTQEMENTPTPESKPEFNLDKDLLANLLHHGLKQNQISEFLNDPDIGLTGIEEGYLYFKKQSDAGKIHSNKSAYLFKSIKDKYGERNEEQKKIDRKSEISAEIKKKKELYEKHYYRMIVLGDKELELLENDLERLFKEVGHPLYKTVWKLG